MKVIKKNVYYCDFCKKHSLSPSLAIHEKHCTANPDRECRLCDNKSVKPIIEKYKKFFTIEKTEKVILGGQEWEVVVKPTFKKQFTLEDIENELDYTCPNCILTVIRCLGLNRYYFDKKFQYDYKKALDEWWEAENDKLREGDERSQYY